MSMSNAVRVQSISCVVSADVFARLMVGTIASGTNCGIVRLKIFIVRSRVSFISFTAAMHLAKTLFAPEGQSHQACHVKRSHSRGDEADDPQDLAAAENARRKSLPEDFVFREESSERNDAADREPTHSRHLLFVMHAMNDRTRSKEEQCFEERVGEYMEDRADERAYSGAQKHVSELRYGRIGQNLLNICLSDSNRGGDESSQASYQRYNHHHRDRALKDEVGARHHKNTGSHHRRGMYQSGHRCWAGHRVREPDVQRYLRALAGSSDEQAERNPRHQSELP